MIDVVIDVVMCCFALVIFSPVILWALGIVLLAVQVLRETIGSES